MLAASADLTGRDACAGCQHDHNHQSGLACTGQAQDLVFNDACYAGFCQAATENEDGPDGDYRWIAEARQAR